MGYIQSVRGFTDLIDEQCVRRWQTVEGLCCHVAQQYGYHEVRLPYLEDVALFSRGIGDTSDIVHKEMYTFSDKNSQHATLLPV